jgi:hypothetical protein
MNIWTPLCLVEWNVLSRWKINKCSHPYENGFCHHQVKGYSTGPNRLGLLREGGDGMKLPRSEKFYWEWLSCSSWGVEVIPFIISLWEWQNIGGYGVNKVIHCNYIRGPPKWFYSIMLQIQAYAIRWPKHTANRPNNSCIICLLFI